MLRSRTAIRVVLSDRLQERKSVSDAERWIHRHDLQMRVNVTPTSFDNQNTSGGYPPRTKLFGGTKCHPAVDPWALRIRNVAFDRQQSVKTPCDCLRTIPGPEFLGRLDAEL